MEDILWLACQETRALQELRAEIHGVWSDEASVELNRRYLQPHGAENELLLASLGSQQGLLLQAEAVRISAADAGRKAGQCSNDVAGSLERMECERQNAFHAYDVFRHVNSDARAKFPVILDLIQRANSV